MRRIAWVLAALPTALALVTAGCGSISPGSGSITTSSYISGVSAGGTSAVYHPESAPAAGSGPGLSVSGPTNLVPGGSATMQLTATTDMNAVYVSVSGLTGYYQVTLPAAATTTPLILTLKQSLPQLNFTVNYNAADAGGTLGATIVQPLTALQVSTGTVQVSVSWSTQTDIDLHLVEPDGTEIYYGNRVSSDGGTLDLDSNAGCAIDGRDNENITWPSGSPPQGTYTVLLDYFAACGVAGTTPYTVTVQIQGQAAQVFSGAFSSSEADFGGRGAGRTVTTFTY